jgi:anaerobic magnesium-protoporphyrin IX monomethyl ester cyclase
MTSERMLPMAGASAAQPSVVPRSRPIRKILLVQPPAFSRNDRGDMTPNAPMGPGYIAAVLEQAGYEVRILDALIEGWDQETRITNEKILIGLTPAQIREVIAGMAPDVVGVSSMFTSQRVNAHAIAGIAKEIDPSTVVVFGGAHPTAAPEMVLADPAVDYVVLSEGENTIVPLLRAIEEGTDLNRLDGVAFRGPSSLVVKPKTDTIADIDSIPFPARHLMPMEKYFAAGIRHGGYARRSRGTAVITSRGCPYLCNFCTAFKVFTRVPRVRSVANIMAEIDELVVKYGVNEIFFEDDQFIAKVKHTEELLDAMISRKYDLIWDTPNGISAWLLSERLIAKMAEAGCYRVNLAIESGNQYVLDNIIHKPVKIEKIPETARLIRKYGMELGTFLVVGNIGTDAVETEEQLRDSFRFARKLRVWPHASYLTPYPGSDVLRIAEERGYLIPGFNYDDLVINKQSLTTPEWTPEKLRRIVEHEKLKTRIALVLGSPEQLFTQTIPNALRHPVDFARRMFQNALTLARG